MTYKGNRKIPKWWKKIRKDEVCCRSLPCQDHTSYSKDNKYVYFEPYNRHMEEVEALINFCKENNLEFNISGESTWKKGSTMLIEIYQKEEMKCIRCGNKKVTRNHCKHETGELEDLCEKCYKIASEE